MPSRNLAIVSAERSRRAEPQWWCHWWLEQRRGQRPIRTLAAASPHARTTGNSQGAETTTLVRKMGEVAPR